LLHARKYNGWVARLAPPAAHAAAPEFDPKAGGGYRTPPRARRKAPFRFDGRARFGYTRRAMRARPPGGRVCS
jgi:hypothetical protein